MLSKLSRNNVSNPRKQRCQATGKGGGGMKKVEHGTDRSIDRRSAIMTGMDLKAEDASRRSPFRPGSHFLFYRLPHYSQIIRSAFDTKVTSSSMCIITRFPCATQPRPFFIYSSFSGSVSFQLFGCQLLKRYLYKIIMSNNFIPFHFYKNPLPPLLNVSIFVKPTYA